MPMGVQRNRLIPYREFLRTWAKTGNWTLRVVPLDPAARSPLGTRARGGRGGPRPWAA